MWSEYNLTTFEFIANFAVLIVLVGLALCLLFISVYAVIYYINFEYKELKQRLRNKKRRRTEARKGQ